MEGEASSSWLSQLNNIGPWILSLLALIQVWVLEAWRKLRTGNIEIHANQIEVGYGALGPVFSIFGTLRCTRSDVFIEEVRAELIRERDNARHSFTWLAVRPTTISVTGDSQEELEIASAFQVKKGNSRKFGFLFHEERFREEHGPTLEELQQEWFEYYREESENIIEQANRNGQQITDYSALSQQVFNMFVDDGRTTDEFTEMDRACYWEEGDYRITIKVDASSPDKIFERDFTFSLSEREADALRGNAMVAIRETCNQPHNYQFAHPNLEKA